VPRDRANYAVLLIVDVLLRGGDAKVDVLGFDGVYDFFVLGDQGAQGHDVLDVHDAKPVNLLAEVV